ncbi:MAG: hypothetical protein M3N50_12555 [Pseudomonadota bacterium]|nr:hypothetical protein [Pseudomonadota bacterium]
MDIHTWLQRLTQTTAVKLATTPLRELKSASAATTPLRSRAAAALAAVLLIGGACITQLREPAARKASDGAAAPGAPISVTAHAPEAPHAAESTQPAEALVTNARNSATAAAVDGLTQDKPAAHLPPPLAISVDGYQVNSEHHFVEIRVRRNQTQKNASFAWWTEPATARGNVDYVHQAKALQTFPSQGLSTRFYVKLLPELGRSQREYFYVAIAQYGRDRDSNKVTRVQIWLPTPRDQLQARR